MQFLIKKYCIHYIIINSIFDSFFFYKMWAKTEHFKRVIYISLQNPELLNFSGAYFPLRNPYTFLGYWRTVHPSIWVAKLMLPRFKGVYFHLHIDICSAGNTKFVFLIKMFVYMFASEDNIVFLIEYVYVLILYDILNIGFQSWWILINFS